MLFSKYGIFLNEISFNTNLNYQITSPLFAVFFSNVEHTQSFRKETLGRTWVVFVVFFLKFRHFRILSLPSVQDKGNIFSPVNFHIWLSFFYLLYVFHQKSVSRLTLKAKTLHSSPLSGWTTLISVNPVIVEFNHEIWWY